eukprot:5174769-Prymnesium_polylepis.1
MALVDYLEDLTDVNFAASVDATGTDVETGEFDYELETEDGLHVAADYFDVEKVRDRDRDRATARARRAHGRPP